MTISHRIEDFKGRIHKGGTSYVRLSAKSVLVKSDLNGDIILGRGGIHKSNIAASLLSQT